MKTSLLLLCLAALGCATARPTSLSLPRELGAECATNCAQLDMRMTAVVIIMNSAGCVCEPKQTTATPPTAGSATIAGGAAIQAVIQSQRQSQASRQQQQSPSSSTH